MLLGVAAIGAVLLPRGYYALVDAIRPPSVDYRDIPIGQNIHLYPWFPGADIVGSLLKFATALLAFVALRAYARTFSGLGLSIGGLRVFPPTLWWAATLLATATAVSETAGWFPAIRSACNVANAVTTAFGVLLNAALVLAVILSLVRVLTAAHRRRLRHFARICAIATILVGAAIIGRDTLLTVWYLSGPPEPKLWVATLAGPDYIIIQRGSGYATRATTVPADALAQMKDYLKSFKPSSPRAWMLEAYMRIEGWAHWPAVATGLALLALLIVVAGVAHRSMALQITHSAESRPCRPASSRRRRGLR
ncbi:MAG: hypothetical protein IT450_09230 [Phycisphaerales bacterium]|nr:hypothetical protein [Phycisphaerales bacterium]